MGQAGGDALKHEPVQHSLTSPAAAATVLSVSQVTQRIKNLLTNDDALTDVSVRGEVMGASLKTRGHLYFTLKDAGAALPCVIWSSDAARVTTQPANGLRVICRGSIDVYAPHGKYQFIVRQAQPDGIGALFEKFEALKRKLDAEGMFDRARKRPLPRFPRTVGIATATTGAAIGDLLTIIRARAPGTRVLVFPTTVQGPEAAIGIARSIRLANQLDELEVLIVGRGGGAMEDLWAFNEEIVARAAAQSRVPIVSAVGHATDTTILDLVADLRAETPTHAAELVVRHVAELERNLQHFSARAAQSLHRRAEVARHRLLALLSRRVLTHPQTWLAERRLLVDEQWQSAYDALRGALTHRTQTLAVASGQLDALDPRAVLRRGYGLFQRKDGSLISRAAEALRGERAEVVLRDGTVGVVVE